MGKVKLVKKVLTAAEKRLEAGAKKLAALQKKKNYPPSPVTTKMPKVVAKPKVAAKPKVKQAAKPKTKTEKATKAAGSIWGGVTKTVKDISHTLGVGGRAAKRTFVKTSTGKKTKSIYEHVGRNKGKYATGGIVSSSIIIGKSGW